MALMSESGAADLDGGCWQCTRSNLVVDIMCQNYVISHVDVLNVVG